MDAAVENKNGFTHQPVDPIRNTAMIPGPVAQHASLKETTPAFADKPDQRANIHCNNKSPQDKLLKIISSNH